MRGQPEGWTTMIAYRLLNAQTKPEFQQYRIRTRAPGQVVVANAVNAAA